MVATPKALSWCQTADTAYSCWWNWAWGCSSGRTTNLRLSLFCEDQLYIPPYDSSVQMTDYITTLRVHFSTLPFVFQQSAIAHKARNTMLSAETSTKRRALGRIFWRICSLEWILNWLQFLSRKKKKQGKPDILCFQCSKGCDCENQTA